jgi:hypothetical protein
MHTRKRTRRKSKKTHMRVDVVDVGRSSITRPTTSTV